MEEQKKEAAIALKAQRKYADELIAKGNLAPLPRGTKFKGLSYRWDQGFSYIR